MQPLKKTSQWIYGILSAVLCIYLILAALAAMPSHAQEQSGIDFVFVIDQSGSMAKTDPQGLSLDAVRDGMDAIFSRIVERRLAGSYAEQQTQEYRLALITFGSSAKTLVNLDRIRIAEDPATRMLSPNLSSSIIVPPEQANGTSFSAALSEVCLRLGSTIDCSQSFPASRKRVVILLTDGEPASNSGLEAIYSQQNPTMYFDQLRQTYQRLLKEAQLWIIGIDKIDAFWPKNKVGWDTIAPGHTARITAPEDVTKRFQDIADAVFASGAVSKGVCNGSEPITIPPYLSSVSFVLNYEDAANQVSAGFFAPSEWAKPQPQPLTTGDPSTSAGLNQVRTHNKTKLSELFVIQRPESGIWHCRHQSDGVPPTFRVRLGLTEIGDVSLRARSEEAISACKPFGFVVAIRDGNNNPLAEDSAHPLYLRALLRSDPEHVKRVKLERTPKPGVWASAEDIEPGQQGGTYSLTIEAALTPEEPAFFQREETIDVPSEYPCSIDFLSPKQGGTYPLADMADTHPLTVELRLTRADGQPIPAELFGQPTSKAISATVTLPNGRTEPFIVMPTDRAGVFAVALPSLTLPGRYRMQAAFRGTADGQTYHTTLVSMITFERVIDQRYILAQTGTELIWLGSSGVLLVLIGALAYLVTPPYPRGAILIETRREGSAGLLAGDHQWERVAIPLASRRVFGLPTRVVWISRELPATLGVKRLEVTSQGKQSSGGVRVKIVRRSAPAIVRILKDDGTTLTLSGTARLIYESYQRRGA